MATSFDISEFIDSRPVGGYQLRILVTCFIVMLLDGFDMQVLGLAVQAMAHEWGLTPKDFALAQTAGPVGMFIGAMSLGPLADRYGRRRPIIAAVFVFGLFTALTVFVHTTGALALMRLIMGFGLGGVIPNVVALSSEYVPSRYRGTLSTLAFTGVPLGALGSAAFGTWMIPAYGWQSVFYLGGFVPLAIAAYALLALPESIRFIAAHAGRSEEAAAVIKKIAPEVQLPQSVQFTIHEAVQKKTGVASLFGPGRTVPTVFLTLIFMCNTFGVYFFMSWLPVLMKQIPGVTVKFSLVSAILLNGGGALGTATLGYLIDRFGVSRVMIINYIIGGLAVVAVGMGTSPAMLIPAILVTGTCMMGPQCAMYAVAAIVYPTAIRASGVGITMGVGRLGSVIGPLVGGIIIALKWPISMDFMVASLPIFAASLFIYIIARAPKNFGEPSPT
jgi:AAHS family 4-hydroxybenzoate transporter-like MFS transporter